jgi:hypothetical protein
MKEIDFIKRITDLLSASNHSQAQLEIMRDFSEIIIDKLDQLSRMLHNQSVYLSDDSKLFHSKKKLIEKIILENEKYLESKGNK